MRNRREMRMGQRDSDVEHQGAAARLGQIQGEDYVAGRPVRTLE